MAYAFVNNSGNTLVSGSVNNNGAGSTTVTTAALPAGAVAGNMIVGVVLYASNISGGPLTVADNNSVAQNIIRSPLQGSYYCAIYWKNNTQGAPTTFTATMTGGAANNWMLIYAEQYSGFAAGAGLDTGGSSAFTVVTSSTAANSMVVGPISTLIDGDFIWVFCINETNAGTITAGTVPAYTLHLNNGTAGDGWYSETLTQTTHGSVSGTWQGANATDTNCHLGMIALTQTTPVTTPACVRGGLSLLGVGCAIGAAKKIADKIEEGSAMTRRSLLLPPRRLTASPRRLQ